MLKNDTKKYRLGPACALAAFILLWCAETVAAAEAAGKPVVPDTIAQRALACSACHGKEGRATQDGFFPRIAGKPAGYLYNQLRNFRDGRRHNPMMAYMVTQLSDDYLKELADYFSGLHPPYPAQPPVTVSAAVLQRGRQLAIDGDAALGIPACSACHGAALTGVAPAVPGLVGLPRDYLNAQFGAWKNGSRQAAAPDCMAQVATRLTVEDISAASSWLAAQPVPADAAPQATPMQRLPLQCGSVPAAR
ncbi:MAG: c-type cytochrome [Herminiimonas sp.]|nr:c-type cytochrome [Herminiimonas sp.]